MSFALTHVLRFICWMLEVEQQSEQKPTEAGAIAKGLMTYLKPCIDNNFCKGYKIDQPWLLATYFRMDNKYCGVAFPNPQKLNVEAKAKAAQCMPRWLEENAEVGAAMDNAPDELRALYNQKRHLLNGPNGGAEFDVSTAKKPEKKRATQCDEDDDEDDFGAVCVPPQRVSESKRPKRLPSNATVIDAGKEIDVKHNFIGGDDVPPGVTLFYVLSARDRLRIDGSHSRVLIVSDIVTPAVREIYAQQLDYNSVQPNKVQPWADIDAANVPDKDSHCLDVELPFEPFFAPFEFEIPELF